METAMTGNFFSDGSDETGTVKFFKGESGYGFIQPQKPGQDVFFHVSVLRAAGHLSASEGDRVTYIAEKKPGKKSREVTCVIRLQKR